MKKLFYKFLLWFCNTTIKRTELLHAKHSKKMGDCLDVINALMQKSIDVEETYRANINLSVACLPQCLDAWKDVVVLCGEIRQGNGFMSRMDKMVEHNEVNYEKMMTLVNSGVRVSYMKHELELVMQATFREYFMSQSRAVNLKHMNVILFNHIEKLNKLCKE